MKLRAMTLIDYVRHEGLANICPDRCPPEVLRYLGVSKDGAHFQVRADCGNEGSRLEVGQAACEWDNIPDPWRNELER